MGSEMCIRDSCYTLDTLSRPARRVRRSNSGRVYSIRPLSRFPASFASKSIASMLTPNSRASARNCDARGSNLPDSQL